jgi:hypothetical protein
MENIRLIVEGLGWALFGLLAARAFVLISRAVDIVRGRR